MVDAIPISREIAIPMDDVEIHAIRAQGAGGQNVNKLATAIHLRFDFDNCNALPERVRRRIAALDDSRVTSNGIVIKAQQYRSQARNRQAAIERLQELIRDVLVEPQRRIATRPSKKARQKRVDDKRQQGRLKRQRGRIDDD